MERGRATSNHSLFPLGYGVGREGGEGDTSRRRSATESKLAVSSRGMKTKLNTDDAAQGLSRRFDSAGVYRLDRAHGATNQGDRRPVGLRLFAAWVLDDIVTLVN